MKTGKVIGGAALGLIAIVAIIGYFLLSNLDDIIKGVMEDVGSKVTGTEVSIDKLTLDLKTGKGRINGLTIANPRGYDSDYAFNLDNVVVAISTASLSKPVIVITQVKIDGAKLIAEQKGEKTNLSELLDNIEKSSSSGGKGQGKTKQAAPADEVRLMMKKFAFINTQATIITETGDEKSLKMPDVHRSNIGNKKTGLTPEQMTEEILGSVVEAVEKAAGQYLAELAGAAIEKKLTENMGDEDKSKVEGLKSLFSKDK